MAVVSTDTYRDFSIRVFWYKVFHPEAVRGARTSLAYGYKAEGDGMEIEGLGMQTSRAAYLAAEKAIDNCLDQKPLPRGRYRVKK